MYTAYFYKFIQLFAKGYKNKLIVLFFMSLIAGFLEFLGISLIFPLIIIILNPEKVMGFDFLAGIFNNYSRFSILLGLSLCIIFAFLLKNIFMIFNSYYQISVLKEWQCNLNLILFKMYLFSSYESKLRIPSKYSIFQVWQLSGIVFVNFVSRVLNIASSSIIFGIILLFLVWKFKFWAVLTGVFFCISGLAQNKFFKTKGRELIKQRIGLMDNMNKSILGAINNIKDIKIFAKEKYFYNEYKKQTNALTRIAVLSDFYSSIPQNIIEIFIIVSIIIMCFGIAKTSSGNSDYILASLGMLAAAMFRMAPLVNKIQMHMNIINANKPVVQEFFGAYDYYKKFDIKEEICGRNLILNNSLKINDLSYSYADKEILSGLNLEIKKGEFVGIIGASGIGKTTFIDILMGLLVSYGGNIFIDDVRIDGSNIQNWINNVSYVPQEITILPVSIRQNIAFGETADEINNERIEKAVKDAQLEEYINSLPDGINTQLNTIQGLSQGQKQRIGIARALYKNSQFLFLDEVTSALDVETENKITECLNNLKGDKTILAIAHRLSTLKKCDRIFYFKSGKEVLSGSFEELMAKDDSFVRLVKLSMIK